MKHRTGAPGLLGLFLAMLVFSMPAPSQSGRRPVDVKRPAPLPAQQVKEHRTEPEGDDPVQATAEKNQDYGCSDDGSLGSILEADDLGEVVVAPKDLDVVAVITAKPKPSYTKEARRNGIQGFVTVRALLSARGKIGRVRVLKGLPSGLTENAIRAACKVEFKPGRKNGETVAQWLTVEYVFRLADSSVFTP